MHVIKQGVNYIQLDDDGNEIARGRVRPKQDNNFAGVEELIKQVDPFDDSKWTKKGLVKMAVLEEVYGNEIDRVHIQTISKSWTRKQAIEAAEK